MKIVRHRLYVAYLLTPLLLPYLCFYFCNKLINSDFENSGGIKYFIVKLVWDRPYRNIFCHRIGRKHLLFSWLLPRCPYTHLRYGMPVGKNLQMEHAYNTFLNAVSIGDNFSCFHNVTIGQKGGKLPTIGNNVTVSCGASILGDVVIGNNVVVGAGCVVVHDVPDNCTVVGNPARVVKQNGKRVDYSL